MGNHVTPPPETPRADHVRAHVCEHGTLHIVAYDEAGKELVVIAMTFDPAQEFIVDMSTQLLRHVGIEPPEFPPFSPRTVQ